MDNNNWISCKDQLPPLNANGRSEIVAVKLRGDDEVEGYLYGKMWCNPLGYCLDIFPPTHWKPKH